MTILAPKRSTESQLYVFDWTHQLAPTGDAIESFELTIDTGTITAPAANQSNTNEKVQALIVGGADGETATLALTITTFGGQVLTRNLSLTISDTATAIYPSTNTKRQIVDLAFEEITLAEFEFNVTPEEQSSALRRLDALMGEWASPGKGLDLGYNFPATFGDSDLDDASGVPDFAVNTVALYLALAIAPFIGSAMSAETKRRMREGMDALRASVSIIPNRQLPYSTPLGAGQKPYSTWAPFVGSYWGRRQ